MQRRQQQIERLATIGQVAGGIAHELRNPLNVIKTSVYYLRNSANLSQEKLTSHLERIDRQASVADNVIGALNSFARLPLPEMQPTRLDECLREVLELIGLPEGIQLTLDLPPTLPLALADRQQLSIVFGNLIRNARDAMPQGGALAIRGRHKAGFIEIDVEDSGMGIHPDNLGKIMEPLYSTKARGIGLGLPIARAIVEKHRGRLTVVSQPCHGTKFTVELLAASNGSSNTAN
jgi:signal transduction histidine kinase